MSKVRDQSGFTILELLIATMVFSVILLLVTYGIIQIGNSYYKATLQAQTQTATRNAVDEVSRNLQFSGGSGQVFKPATLGVPGSTGAYCNNGIQYAYVLGSMQDAAAIKHTLVARADPGNCAVPTLSYFQGDLVSGERDLLGDRMRIVAFDVAPAGTVDGMFSVKLRVVTGEDDLLCSPSANDCNTAADSTNLGNADLLCKTQSGSTYCAVSELSAVVARRLVN